MSRLLTLLFATALMNNAFAAEEIQDATIAAPEAHSVEFENEHVRVISAIASPGHKSPMHSHPPSVVISMDTARIKVTTADGEESIVNFRPGTAFWLDGATHKWELLGGEINAVAVEVKSAKEARGAAEATGAWPPVSGEIPDSTIADPGAHSVLFENEYVRVISAIASAGYESAMHSHPALLVVQMDTGRVQLTDAQGNETIVNVLPGMVFWLDKPTHRWELLNGNLNAIAVEVKAAAVE